MSGSTLYGLIGTQRKDIETLFRIVEKQEQQIAQMRDMIEALMSQVEKQ